MKTIARLFTVILPLAAGLCVPAIGLAADENPPLDDPGWPREFVVNDQKLTIYQPQVDEWKDHSTIHFRCAIQVEGVLKEAKFGVAEIDAATLVESTTRVVKLFSTKREIRFAGVTPAEEKSLTDAVDVLSPPERLVTISLDRLMTCLDPETAAAQKPVDISLAPPPIFYSSKPAVLVIFLGDPQFKPVVADNPDLMFALNTNWDVFFQPSTKSYYLLNVDHWLTATSAEGPWTVAAKLPESLSNLPDNENWDGNPQTHPRQEGRDSGACLRQQGTGRTDRHRW